MIKFLHLEKNKNIVFLSTLICLLAGQKKFFILIPKNHTYFNILIKMCNYM